MFNIAVKYRDGLRRCLARIDAPAIDLDRDEVDVLAVAVTELAEDLHADAGLWRCLEAYHGEFFGVPLPLLCQPEDTPLETFDARRFQFFLYSVWQHFHPDHIVSPNHRGFVALADHASAYFGAAFARLPRHSPTRRFLATSNTRGWEVKRKLVWLGSRSFLFRFAHGDYQAKRASRQDEEIDVTDDFLHLQCTAWSGLGVLDVLAGTLDLPEEDRAVLRGWHERHAAIYRIERLETKGQRVEFLESVNLVNDRAYCIRTEEDLRTNPFQPGMAVFGSLVPWRGEWYWSGLQRLLKVIPDEVAALRKSFREKGSLAFRYCPDLEERAREIETAQYADFTVFYGNDLVAFPDEQSAHDSERERLLAFSIATAGNKLRSISPTRRATPPDLTGIPEDRLSGTDKVAVFYHKGEGVEIFTGYAPLLSALKKREGILTEDETQALRAFIEEASISPAFVRRLVRETGSAAIERLYYLTEHSGGIEYLLRRFKGHFFRRRYPTISIQD